jgi:uncharacterized protein (TIGR02145 family)
MMKKMMISAVLILSLLQGQFSTYAQNNGNLPAAGTVSKGTDPADTTKKADTLSCGRLTYEGQIYHTVKIGSMCWMSENLNVGKWTDTSQEQQPGDNGIIEKYCFGNDFTQCDFWGGLYQWNEMMAYSQKAGAQGICPDGWHVPSSQEWKSLIRFLGTEDDAGGRLKSTLQWKRPNVGADNASGFSAYPSGYYDSMAHRWNDLYMQGYYWTSEMITTTTAVGVNLTFRTGGINMYEEFQPSALAVRCIKN